MRAHVSDQKASPGRPAAPQLAPAWWLKVLAILLAAAIAGVFAGALGPKDQPAENLREVQEQMISGALYGMGIITLLGVIVLVQHRGRGWRRTLVLWLRVLPYWVGFGAVFAPIYHGIKPAVVGLPGNWSVRLTALVLGPAAFGLLYLVLALSYALLRVFAGKQSLQRPHLGQGPRPTAETRVG
jgi:hypothetical protein